MSHQLAKWFIAGILLATLFSCESDFDINGDYIEKVVVFGLLDYGEDTNFIRIEKTFLEANTNAILLAANSEQIFYGNNELEVYLEEWNNGIYQRTIPVTYVDGDSLGLEKEEGVFSTSPNILYRITTPLDSTSAYTIYLIKTSTEDTITATTQLVQNYHLYFPTYTTSYMNFADTGKMTYTCKQAVNAMLYELTMDFNYYEKNVITGDSVLKTINWQIFNNKEGDNIEGNGNISYVVLRHAFFNFLASSIDENPDVIRTAVSVNYHWYAGGKEVYDLYLNMLANVGINQEYISPEYTNVNGGIGLFSSRHGQHVMDLSLYEATIDSIACGSITGNLRFLSSPANPAYPGCSF